MNQASNHTSSYYAATVNDVTDFGPLQGAHSADVCIIGAGFTGISTALHLAERGYDVHVLDANKVGWGASGRNGGQVIGGISGEDRMLRFHGRDKEDLLWEMRWAGNRIIRDRIRTYGIECDFKYGYADVAIRQRHVRQLREEYETLVKRDFPGEFRLLDRDETRDTIGTDAYIGALMNMANGHVHPLNLCIGEARAAVSLGARINEQSPVVRIEKKSRPRAVTENGSVTADFVVIAGNAYHFLERKLRGHVLPVNSYIIATEPLPEKLVNSVNPRDIAVCDPNYILHYFRLSADKRLLFGGRCNYTGDDPEIIRKNLVPRMLGIYPQLKNVNIDYAWGGRIGVTVNRVPQMGRLSSNIFYSQGYSGHGVNVTHLAGQIMADCVAGTFERFDIFADIKPVVLPGAHVFRKQLVALGMLLYRIRDRL